MKRMPSRTVMLGFSILLGGGMLFAQDLAQLAKKTRQESLKTKQQQSVRIWNNDNIPKAPARGGPTTAGGMAPAPPADTSPVPPQAPAPAPESAESEEAALESMKGQIKQDEQSIKGLEERLRLEEDELSLLQIQQASELAPSVQSEVSDKIKTKNAEIAAQRQAIEKAQKDLEASKKEFKAKGGTLEEQK